MAAANVLPRVEYLPPLLRTSDRLYYRARPRHFRLSMLRPSDNDGTTGKALSFQDNGRVFYIGAVLPAKTSESLRRTIEFVLDSLRIEARHRCRPSAGSDSSVP